jgi:hypothetical protein
MILARGENKGGKEILLMGLSRENINRLTKGEPIALRRETHGEGVPEGWEIFIYFGETELAMKAELQKIGAINKDTKVTVDPRL